MKILIKIPWAPGDVCCATSVIRDLHRTDDEICINVEGSAMELWANNPNLDRSVNAENAHRVIRLDYPGMNHSLRFGTHSDAMRRDLERCLGMNIPPGDNKPDLYLTAQEKERSPLLPSNVEKYWILNASFKEDATTKGWGDTNFEKLVKLLEGKITFVQIGHPSASTHNAKLSGVVDLVGKTNHRQLMQLMYRASGCVSGISYPMHLCAGIPMPDGSLRPCIVFAGGREPVHYICYPGHHVFSTIGMLDCCNKGGCWRSLLSWSGKPELDRGRSLCNKVDCDEAGRSVPHCMRMITPEEVAGKILKFSQK